MPLLLPIAAVCAQVMLLLAPGVALAQRAIGANLARPADAQYGCEALPSTDAFGNRLFLPSGAQTCTYLGTGGLGDTSESTGAPAGGVITRVRVKAGPLTGPTQVTVLRATRSGVGFACCFYAGASAVFTPTPNAVTTLAVRLPVRNDLDPSFGETVDYLGVTVLAPGVPIPAQEVGNPGDIRNPGALAFFPHVRPGDERADGAGVGGVVPLVNADFVALCSGRAARAAQGGGACVPFLAVENDAGRVRGTRVTLPLTCNLAAGCAGLLRLQSRSAGASASRRRGATTYASVRFQLTSGAAATATARLTKAGRRLVRERRRVRVWAVARTGSGTSELVASRRVTLRR